MDQALGVGVTRGTEKLLGRCPLGDPSRIHHEYFVANLSYHTQIVGDEDDGHAVAALQLRQQFQYLRLDGYVECGGGFIGDQNPRGCRTTPSRSSLAGACRPRVDADTL
ncbi:MAG: hypothetical protein CM1200mP36_07830 [Gammaproteobacteria bacterium]|nr:MAG: hypothetical protein CM1200mP36_07830 [Gammaproteobacteria bacterium]